MVRVTLTVLLVLWMGLDYSSVTCDMYSSVAKLTEIIKELRQDDTLTSYLDVFISKLSFQEEEIIKYAVQLRDLTTGIREPAFDPKHPLDVLKFIRNHTFAYNETTTQLLKAVNKVAGLKFDKQVLSKTERLYPKDDDYLGILQSIYRLQQVYDLNVTDVALGILYDTETSPLTAAECIDIAHYCIAKRNLYQAREWSLVAIWLATTQNDKSIPLEDLYNQMAITAFVAGEMEDAVMYMEDHIRLLQKSKSRRSRKLLRHFKYERDSDMVDEGEGWELVKKSKRMEKFDALCQGRVLEFADTARREALQKLKCRFEKSRNPFYKYQRIRLEERSLSPYIVIYHDAFSESDLARLQTIALPKLQRASVDGKGSAENVRFDEGIGQKMTLDLKQTKTMRHFIRRIEALTSLHFSSSSFESLEVLYFHYEDPHWIPDIYTVNLVLRVHSFGKRGRR